MKYNIYRLLLRLSQWVTYRLACLFSIKNKIVATAVVGRRYADNPKFIYEEILRQGLDIELIWVRDPEWEVKVPKGIRSVSSIIDTMYAYATAKVIISTTNYPFAYRKRKGQCVINTWHGGLGIKKMENTEIWGKRLCTVTDVFISNSNFSSQVFRNAFRYKGPIWKCGYPRNDFLIGEKAGVRNSIREKFGLAKDIRIMIYAPTFRDYPTKYNPYDIDFNSLLSSLKERDNKEWFILIKYHPNLQYSRNVKRPNCDHVKDVTSYHDMQELIAASDALISDYSSCIFDAALAGLECYIYANDFVKYQQERGTYFELHELPFPVATNNSELMSCVKMYNHFEYRKKWAAFSKEQGLVETGHASKDIVGKISDYINSGNVSWENTDI